MTPAEQTPEYQQLLRSAKHLAHYSKRYTQFRTAADKKEVNRYIAEINKLDKPVATKP